MLVGFGAACLGIFSIILFLGGKDRQSAEEISLKGTPAEVGSRKSEKAAITEATETTEDQIATIDRVIGKILKGGEEPPDWNEVTAVSSLRTTRQTNPVSTDFSGRALPEDSPLPNQDLVGPPFLPSTGGKEVIESLIRYSGKDVIERQAYYSGKEVIESAFNLSGKQVLETIGNGGDGAGGGLSESPGSGGIDQSDFLGAASEGGEKKLLPYVPLAAGGGATAGLSTGSGSPGVSDAGAISSSVSSAGTANSASHSESIGNLSPGSGAGSSGISSAGRTGSPASGGASSSIPSVSVGPPSNPVPRTVRPILPGVVPPLVTGGVIAGGAGGGVPPVITPATGSVIPPSGGSIPPASPGITAGPPTTPPTGTSTGISGGTVPPHVTPPIPAGGIGGVAPIAGGVIPPAVIGSGGGTGGNTGAPPGTQPPPATGNPYSPPGTTSTGAPPSTSYPPGTTSNPPNTSVAGSGSSGGLPPVVPIIPGGTAAGGAPGAGVVPPLPPSDPGGGETDTDDESHDFPGQCIPWVVQPGQTIESLAAATGTTPAEIRKINKVASIRPGQMIKLPAAFVVPCCD